MNKETKYLISRLYFMNEIGKESEFFKLESLFTEEVDVPAVVEIFEEIYGVKFQAVTKSPKKLYEEAKEWFESNTR